jgi:riboflavin kinase / FMN adenylyltransferase
MKIIEHLKNFQEQRKTSLAIGVFDGVHRGHARVIKQAVSAARSLGALPSVLTFRLRPAMPLKKTAMQLTSFDHKMRLIGRLGCEKAYVVSEQDLWFFDMSAEDFIAGFLKNRLMCVSVAVGENFRFGKGREAYIKDAAHLFRKHGIRISIVPLSRAGGDAVSSSQVRKRLEKDDFKGAARLLGRSYSLGGFVTRGKKLGGSIGVSTANIDVSEERVMLDGIYACRARIGEGRKIYKGVLSVGTNPTVSDDDAQKVEVHLFGVYRDLYEEFLEVYPVAKVRDTRKFRDIAQLRESILEDIEKAKVILNCN